MFDLFLSPGMTDAWQLHKLGDGTEGACNLLAGGPRAPPDMLECMVRLFAALKPTFEWVVERVLGAGWAVLVTFQMFQGDLVV